MLAKKLLLLNLSNWLEQNHISSEFEHRGKVSVLNAYLVQFDHNGIEKPYVLTEHTEYKWVLPEEIPNLNFVDSDLKIYPAVLEYLKRK